jgi:hypothetical protein
VSGFSALRRLPRPTQILSCPACQAALGTNYASCVVCQEAIERYWLADWHALLAEAEIQPDSPDLPAFSQLLLDEGERHPWTVLDIALTHLRCASCLHELGSGPASCTECNSAWGITLWAEAVAGRVGLVTMNEHALHIGRMILRYPHRQSANIIAAWSRTMPRLLTGWLPSTQVAQHFMALIKAGQMAEVDRELAIIDRKINRDAHKNG